MGAAVKNKVGYKKTKLGWIPEDWEVVPLNNVLALLTDFEANGSFADVKANVSVFDSINHAWYVRATDLENNTALESVKYVDEQSYNFLRKTPLIGGEVLVTKRGEIGKVYFFANKGIKATLAPNLYLLKLKSNVDNKFLFYFLKSYNGFKALNSINASTTMGALYKDDVKKLSIPYPPLPEQQKIATILSTWDKAIEKLTQLVAAKEQRKKGLMQLLLTGKKRFGGYADEWEEVKLEKLISKFIVPMRDKPKDLSGHIPWCRIEDFEGKYLFESKSRQGVSDQVVKDMNLKVYPEGTLLVSCSANLGKCAIVAKALVTNQTFIGLVPMNNSVNTELLYYKMISAADRLNRLSTGTTISYLSREEFEKFKIKIPKSLSEQQKIASTLSSADKEIELLKQELNNLQQQKKGLMQKLLTGEVRVKIEK
jgi:type I restriction enzyme, S subunit